MGVGGCVIEEASERVCPSTDPNLLNHNEHIPPLKPVS